LELHTELVRGCVLCFPEGSNAPVVDAPKDVRVILVGQAPGVTETTTWVPFTGHAGRRLEGWPRLVSRGRRSTSPRSHVVFLRKAKGDGDKVPSRAMLANCRPSYSGSSSCSRWRSWSRSGGWP
jgi:uracil-DNA glycosylase